MASFLSVTNGRTDAYGGSFENRLRLPLEVIEAVRGAVGREFLVGCRYLGSEDILGDGRAPPRQHAGGRAGASAWRWPAPASTSSPSRAAASSTTRKQPPVGEAAYPYTGHSGQVCIPRRKGDPPAVNAFLARGHPGGGARRGLRDAGGGRGQDRDLRVRPRRSCARAGPTSSAWPALCWPIRTCPGSGGPAADRRCEPASSARTARTRTSTTAWSRARSGPRARRADGTASRRRSGWTGRPRPKRGHLDRKHDVGHVRVQTRWSRG